MILSKVIWKTVIQICFQLMQLFFSVHQEDHRSADSLYCDFGIPIDENVYQMTLGSYNEDIVNQACDISMCTHKDNEQTDNNGSILCTSCDSHRLQLFV